jgi:uncharacterized membrane protein YfbV (UPF0208 family)
MNPEDLQQALQILGKTFINEQGAYILAGSVATSVILAGLYFLIDRLQTPLEKQESQEIQLLLTMQEERRQTVRNQEPKN